MSQQFLSAATNTMQVLYAKSSVKASRRVLRSASKDEILVPH